MDSKFSENFLKDDINLFVFVVVGATYCICKDGAQDPTAYQRVIDYACGAGADCRAVQQNGPCYVANNPKAVCDYAVNSYFQNKGQTPEACVFSGAATATNNLPSSMSLNFSISFF